MPCGIFLYLFMSVFFFYDGGRIMSVRPIHYSFRMQIWTAQAREW